MPNKKIIIFAFLGFIVLIIGLVIGRGLVQQQQRFEPEAATPSGTASLHFDPNSATIWLGETRTITVKLNTGTNSTTGYQVIANLAYYTATPPINISATQVTTLEPNLTCLTNSITHDTQAKKYRIVISCVVPLNSNPPPPLIPYTTIGEEKPIFSFQIQAVSPGSITYLIDPENSYVTNSTDGSDLLSFTTGGTFTAQEDTTPPDAITDLSVTNISNTSLDLNWTAPNDPGQVGQAASYDIRYSTVSLTWNLGTVATNLPLPGPAGTNQSYTVTGLTPGTTYNFGIRSTDDKGNESVTSNIATATTLNKGTLNIQAKFQGVSNDIQGKKVDVSLRQSGIVKYTYPNTDLSASGGIYSATIPQVAAGTYDVLIKGPAHLQKLISNIVVPAGGNSQNWPTTVPLLLAGDMSGPSGKPDNKVDLLDYSKLVLDYEPGVTKSSSLITDLNFDGKVDLLDYSLMVLNYNPGVSGD